MLVLLRTSLFGEKLYVNEPSSDMPIWTTVQLVVDVSVVWHLKSPKYPGIVDGSTAFICFVTGFYTVNIPSAPRVD